jgi:hypothetical protein
MSRKSILLLKNSLTAASGADLEKCARPPLALAAGTALFPFEEKAGKLSTVPRNPPEKEQYILEMYE